MYYALYLYLVDLEYLEALSLEPTTATDSNYVPPSNPRESISPTSPIDRFPAEEFNKYDMDTEVFIENLNQGNKFPQELREQGRCNDRISKLEIGNMGYGNGVSCVVYVVDISPPIKTKK